MHSYCDKWGCNWDASEGNLKIKHLTIEADFNTPWETPYAFYERLALEFPDVKITVDYKEDGFCWGGQYLIENGILSKTFSFDGPEYDKYEVEYNGDTIYICKCTKSKDPSLEVGAHYIDFPNEDDKISSDIGDVYKHCADRFGISVDLIPSLIKKIED